MKDRENKLQLGDCLEKMKEIPKGTVDMILCDLPYGTTICKWDAIIPFELLWDEYKRVIKDNGAIVLFGNEPFSSKLRMSNEKWYKYDWVWQKTRPSLFQHANKRPMKDHENICVFYKKQPTYNQELTALEKPNKRWRKNKMGSFLLDGCKDVESKQTMTGYNRQILTYELHNVGLLHPCQKPLPLLEFLIKTYTNEGETVLDNCVGSGSTCVACKNTNRNYIAIEKDEKYFFIAMERLNGVPISNILNF
jgi:site-specific DNA-methyltransferase (adenine-specific)